MKEEIQKFFKGEVLDDIETLGLYSHDASLFEVMPKLIAYPKDCQDVKNLVKWVSENKNKYPELSITARSAGTDMTGGPLNNSIILDFTKHMNKMLSFSDTITVQPGMFYRDFEKIVGDKGLMLPSYPASKSICAMGGMFSNNSGGEKTLRYGKTENYIEKAKLVFSDGNEYEIQALSKNELDQKIKQDNKESNIYKKIADLIEDNREVINKAKPKVSKNSAGYYIWNVEKENLFDLNKLLVGSQGTLGIVTEISFKLVPIPKYSKLVVVFLDDIKKISALVNEVLKYKPESLEAYDDKTLKLAIRFFPNFLKGKGILGAFKFAWSFLPDLFMLFEYGFPKLVVLVEFAGDEEKEIEKKCLDLMSYLSEVKIGARITKSKNDAEKYWEIRHESFNLLRKHVKGKRTAPFIDDIIVRPEFLPEFLPKINEILSKYPELEYTIAGHPGDGNFHIIPLVDLKNPNLKDIVLEVSEKIYNLVFEYQGSITAEHNDGIIRTPYLEKMYGKEIIGIFQKIKEIFDPQNIFNPHKKVGGTFEDIRKYIK